MLDTVTETFDIYLIHFTQTAAGPIHYVGSTPTRRLEIRLRQHATGTGANATAKAVDRGAVLWLARRWQSQSRELERRLKANGHFRKLCPICSGRLDLIGKEKPRRLVGSRLAKSTWRPLGYKRELNPSTETRRRP
jgi:hypothetical protein